MQVPAARAEPSGNRSDVDPKDLGRAGEEVAAEFLERKGWTIRGKNVRVGPLEIDLIASRDDVLAFVEVKSRTGEAFGCPLEAISPRKMRHVARAAAGWIRQRGGVPVPTIRFDAIGVWWPTGRTPRVLHVPDAWRME